LVIALILSLAVHGFLVMGHWEESLFPPLNRGTEKKQITLRLRSLPPTPPAEIQPEAKITEPPKIEKMIQEAVIQPKQKIEPRGLKKEPVPPPPIEKGVQVEKPKEIQEKTIQEVNEIPTEIIEESKATEIIRQEISETPSIPIIQRPKPLSRKDWKTPYPPRAKKRGLQGTVELNVLINTAGNVADIRIITSSGHNILDKAAIKSVLRKKFIPGKRAMVPVEMWDQVAIKFEL